MENNFDFLDIISEYSVPVFRYVYSYVHHIELAEDLAQQTFLKAWEHRSTMDPHLSPLHYLYKIALNEIRMNFRETDIMDSIPVDLEIVDPRSMEPSSLGIFENEQTTLLLEELEKLSDFDRALITYRYIDQMKVKEISAIIGKPILSTRVSLHRALLKLKKRILGIQDGERA